MTILLAVGLIIMGVLVLYLTALLDRQASTASAYKSLYSGTLKSAVQFCVERDKWQSEYEALAQHVEATHERMFPTVEEFTIPDPDDTAPFRDLYPYWRDQAGEFATPQRQYEAWATFCANYTRDEMERELGLGLGHSD